MRAVGYDVVGGAGVLRPMDVPVPAPGPGEVLVRVAYAGVQPGIARPADAAGGTGAGGAAAGSAAAGPVRSGGAAAGVAVPGVEVSGEIAAAGPGVAGLAAGDLVAAYLPDGGGYAEYAVARADFAFPLDGVPLRDGGGAALTLTTAYGVLAAAARLAAGDTVLIHAAASPVAAAAAQIARALGAAAVHGTLVCGTAGEADVAKRYGYDGLHPTATAAFAEAVGEADVVLDTMGTLPCRPALGVLAPFGRLVVAGHGGADSGGVDGRDGVEGTLAAAGPAVDVRELRAGNRAVVGYDLAALARRAPGVVRSHALSALSLLASGAIRIDVEAELPLEAFATAAPHGTTLLRPS